MLDDPWKSAKNLQDAAFAYGDPAQVATLRHLDDLLSGPVQVTSAFDPLGDPDPRELAQREREQRRYADREDASRAVIEFLRRKLHSGALVARGRRTPIDPDRGLEIIHADLWDSLVPDLSNSSANAEGLQYVAVRVLPQGDVPAIRAARETPTIRAQRQCEAWIAEQVEAGATWRKTDALKTTSSIIDRLSERSFKRVWKDKAPAEWKRPGRRKPSQ